jgi:putative CocE/NonD family hydrolase
MAQLAKQAIKTYKEDDNEKYLGNLLCFQMIAEEYEKSIFTLKSYRALIEANLDKAATVHFAFEVFAKTKINQAEKHTTFNDALQNTFYNLYTKLTESQTILVTRSFDLEIKPFEVSFQKALQSQKNKDSINFNDAKELCVSYSMFNYFKQTIPIVRPFLKEIENKLYIIEDSVRIKTKDGSTIQAVIVRSRKILTPQPAILNFNIYIGSSNKSLAKTAAIHGYVGVVANTRGKGISPQNIEPFEQDANDAYDIIDWISKQSWCNGKVGMYGGSYVGFSQWAATKSLHPALKTIIPQVSVGIGIDYPMLNGIYRSFMIRWIHLVTNNKQTDYPDFNKEAYWNSIYNRWYKGGVSFRSMDSVEGRKSNIFQRWLQHPSLDSYWQNMVPYKSDFSKINIPILTITGYFDDDQVGAMYYYKEHLKYNKNANHTFLIGPYDHYGAQGSPSSEWQGYKIDPAANVNISELLFKWFDYTLKDSLRPELLKDKVNYQIMGINEWKHTSSISKMSNDSLLFYFGNDRSENHFKLLTEKPLEKAFIRQEVDYLSRLDTTDFSDEKILSKEMERGEYISFISDRFENPITINTTFFGEIKHIINKKDYDLNIRLYEQLPNGNYFNLSHFLGRASYIKDPSKRQLLTPGKEETIPYSNSFFTCKKLSKGSRLIVLVGVNKNKYWQVNYGTGKDVSDETIQDGKIPLEIKWMNDSYIKIPVWRDK